MEKDAIEGYFVFGVMWSYGGCVIQDALDGRNVFNKAIQALYPLEYSLYDVFYDGKQFQPWSALCTQVEFQSNVLDTLVPTSETIRLSYMLDILMTNKHPVLISGAAGCGKTALINQKIAQLDEFQSTSIPFNYYTTSTLLQPLLEKPLEKKVGKTFGPVGTKPLVYFVDDLNMPEVDKYGTCLLYTSPSPRD